MQAAQIFDEGDDTRKAAARALVDRGLYVFAVKPRDKRPDSLLAPNGFFDASIDVATVEGWFEVKPGANVGVACGADYGLVVIDVDVKGGAPGMETYTQLDLGSYTTLTTRTPSGGYHLYFKHPGVKLKPRLAGIDVKGADGGGS